MTEKNSQCLVYGLKKSSKIATIQNLKNKNWRGNLKKMTTNFRKKFVKIKKKLENSNKTKKTLCENKIIEENFKNKWRKIKKM